jgi:hypothetical protein
MQNSTLGKKLPNVEKFSCITCWNEQNFDISGIERTGGNSWNVLLTCPYCLTSMCYQFHGFSFYDRLLKHVKSMITKQENKERPTSYVEWDLKSGKIFRQTENTKDPGLYRLL